MDPRARDAGRVVVVHSGHVNAVVREAGKPRVLQRRDTVDGGDRHARLPDRLPPLGQDGQVAGVDGHALTTDGAPPSCGNLRPHVVAGDPVIAQLTT